MLSKLHNTEILKNFESVQSQLVLEKDLQQFFKVTPPVKIEGEFRDISGSTTNQFLYLNLVLKVIEELDIEPVQAFALLEAIRPVIYHKFEAATDPFVGKTIVPGSRSAAIVYESIEVFTRLTATYDSVIEEAKHFGDSQTFIMGSAIHRALADKARLVLCYLKIYQEVPADVWRHINTLYRTADTFNIFNQTMPDKLAFPGHSLSVRQLYLYIMLMAAAGTRNINTDEITAFAEFLKDWLRSISIRKYDHTRDEMHLCMDPATLKIPAFACTLADKSSDTLFTFDLDKVAEKLRSSHLNQKFVDGTRYTLSPWTAYKILNNWTTYHERGVSRQCVAEIKTTNAYVGLLMTWLINPPSPEKMHTMVVSENNFRNKKLNFDLSGDNIHLEPILTLQLDKFPSLRPRIVDFSATGYCLQWDESALSRLCVDEVLILQDDNDGPCRLGQIVWIKALSRLEYQTGISIISSDVIPVLARLIPSAHSTSAAKVAKGFITSHQMGERRSHGIILEQAGLRTGQAIELIQNNRIIRARLLEPLSQGDKYQSFNIAFYQD